jgi:methylmalonyl-CoA mutase
MTDTDAPRELAGGFTAANHDMWRQLVDKALKGSDFDRRLVARTADGLKIDPLYTRADVLPGAEAAVPGTAPFTRGTQATSEGFGWNIHQRVGAPDAAAANKVILEELEGGTNGIVLEISAPGHPGIAISSAADMAAALAGVHLDYAPVELAAGIGGVEAARHLLGALAILKPKSGEATSRLNVDPLGAFARYGTAGAPIDAAIAEAMQLAGEARASNARLTTILVDATVAHEAGASEAQELAYLAAALVAYLRAFEKAGVAPAEAFADISFALALDTDLFLNAAKVRAARTIIARIAESCGAKPTSMHIAALTSARMLSKRDPWTNMLRTAAACAAGAFGGADAITVLPYTYALGEADKFARRVARNTQLVLQEESGLGRVVDPAGGSWYVEKITEELAGKAWGLFQDNETQGGLVSALTSGALQDEIARIVETRAKAIATGRQELTGVSVFPNLNEKSAKVAPRPAAPALPGEAQIRPLTPHRLAEPFEALRDAADASLAKTGKRPRIFLANLGQIIEHNRRSTWAWNFLAAGGIEGLNSDGYKDAQAASEAFKTSGTDVACLCSSDEIYAQEGVAAVQALKASGARHILMAGKPGEAEAALRAAGVDAFLFAGQDAVAVLKELHNTMGVA